MSEGERPADSESVPQDPKPAIAVFGGEVEYFVQNDPIGRYLIEKAKREVTEALEALGDADPDDAAAVRKIQHRLRVARSVPKWLGEAIEEGHSARAQLQEEQDDGG